MPANQRGAALAVSVFALVVIGALVTGAFFMGVQEQRLGRNSIRFQQALAAAEEGANREVASWNAAVNNSLATGDSVAFTGTVTGAGGWYRGSIRRLNEQLFLVRSEGFSADSAARQHVGLLVRLRPLEFDISAALETAGKLVLGGSSEIDGHDHVPARWTCPPLKPSLAGIKIDDADNISTSGCEDFACVDGSVKVAEDPTVNPGSLARLGDASFEDLKRFATIIIHGGNRHIQPSGSAGVCDTADANNWGDPSDPSGSCGDYFPVVWSEGDLTINQNRGQGILIVNGDLDVRGGFEFYGPVIVRGAIKTGGTGGRFIGGVIAANVNLEQSDVLGNAAVTYSSCALSRALSASAAGAPIKERSWANLY